MAVLLYFTIICLHFLRSTSGLEITYTIEEEKGPDYYIGEVATDAGLITSNDTTDTEYSLLTEGNKDANFFSVNSRTSSLYTSSRIDHDTLCQFVTSLCILKFDVAAKSPINDFFEVLTVKVVVKDINDNVPTFPSSDVSIEISENSEKGTSYPLLAATDDDSGKNSIQSYRIETENVPFKLDTNSFTFIQIVVDGELDRETNSEYLMHVIAVDGGDTPKTGTLTVRVLVNDVNDNPPMFSRPVYNVTIDEDISANSVILKLNSTDPDEGENGRVLYRLSSHQSDAVQRLFKIDRQTGELRVIGNFIDERSQFYRIIVETSDNATQPLISQAQVFVSILDTHNKAPEITLNVLSDTYYVEVSESAAIGTVLAIITVKDPDNGNNGRITCSINDGHFKLKRNSDQDIYEYNFVLDKQLDRESLEWHSISILCHDYGTPNMNVSTTFSVRVLDVNDNPPTFSRTIYYVDVPENDIFDISILQVKATDTDVASKPNITFSLGLREEFKTLFTIDPRFGIIRLQRPLDREEFSQITFKVFAADDGSPSLTGTALVEVNVKDRNDNYPEFTPAKFELIVPENQLPNVSVGRLVARDNDAEDNGKVSFKLSPNIHQLYMPFIVLENGTIVAEQLLDREHIDRYDFTVIAHDHGTPSLTSTANVTVYIQDINDNAPVFKFPSSDGEVVYVPYNTLPNTVITQIEAYDVDVDVNSKLSYTLLNSNKTKIVTLNEYTGEVYLNKELSPSYKGTYELRVMVRDNGTPQRSRSRTLSIIITDNLEPKPVASPEGKIKYYAIAIAISCVTIVLSILIILAIVLIRRKDQSRDKYPESVSTNSTIDTVTDASNPDIRINGTYTREVIQQGLTDTVPGTYDTSAYQLSSGLEPRTLSRTSSSSRSQPEVISDSVAIWEWGENDGTIDRKTRLNSVTNHTYPLSSEYFYPPQTTFMKLYPEQSGYNIEYPYSSEDV